MVLEVEEEIPVAVEVRGAVDEELSAAIALASGLTSISLSISSVLDEKLVPQRF